MWWCGAQCFVGSEALQARSRCGGRVRATVAAMWLGGWQQLLLLWPCSVVEQACVCDSVPVAAAGPAVRIWLLSRRGLAEHLCAPPLYHHPACVR